MNTKTVTMRTANSEQRTANSEQRTANSEQPLLSVLIISYNEKDYLPYAIDSCLSQTFQNFEIVIGDDGSDDGSLDLIKDYCTKYPDKIKYFQMDRPANKEEIVPLFRVSNVIRNGLTKTNGKYITILSGDDYFCDNKKFADAITFLEAHNNYVSYASAFKWVYDDGREVVTYPPNYSGSLFWSRYYLHAASFIFRSSVFNESNLLNRICDDTGIIFMALHEGETKFDNAVTFAYRQREDSLYHSAMKIEKMIHELVLFQDCLCFGKMRWSTYSRYYNPLMFLYQHRKELNDNLNLYIKYIESCEKYPNNILGEIIKADSNAKSKKFIENLIFKTKLAWKFFSAVIRIRNFPSRVIRYLKRKLGLNKAN